MNAPTAVADTPVLLTATVGCTADPGGRLGVTFFDGPTLPGPLQAPASVNPLQGGT
ncbi:hypothetical protein ACFV29_11820 [Streptomyces sp. NPDC059690]|uniref:hypothetical protein n=1 Tax=Streptomyces sp. NPDC059690 TaxID=3346907 RepID=UPI00367C4DBE